MDSYSNLFSVSCCHRVNVVKDQIESGLYTLKRYAKFLQKIVAARKQSAEAQLKAAEHEAEKKDRLNKDKMMMHVFAFHQMHHLMLQVAKADIKWCIEMTQFVVDPLLSFLRDSEVRRRRVLLSDEKFSVLLSRHRGDIVKERGVALKMWRELQETIKNNEEELRKGKNSREQREKADKTFARVKEKVVKAFQRVESLVEVANIDQSTYENRELPVILTQLEQIEQARLIEMQARGNDLKRIQKEWADNFHPLINTLELAAQKLSAPDSLRTFVDDVLATHGAPPPPLPFRGDLPMSSSAMLNDSAGLLSLLHADVDEVMAAREKQGVLTLISASTGATLHTHPHNNQLETSPPNSRPHSPPLSPNGLSSNSALLSTPSTTASHSSHSHDHSSSSPGHSPYNSLTSSSFTLTSLPPPPTCAVPVRPRFVIPSLTVSGVNSLLSNLLAQSDPFNRRADSEMLFVRVVVDIVRPGHPVQPPQHIRAQSHAPHTHVQQQQLLSAVAGADAGEAGDDWPHDSMSVTAGSIIRVIGCDPDIDAGDSANNNNNSSSNNNNSDKAVRWLRGYKLENIGHSRTALFPSSFVRPQFIDMDVSLRQVVEVPSAMLCFTTFLELEHATENVHFYTAVERFKQIITDHERELKEHASCDRDRESVRDRGMSDSDGEAVVSLVESQARFIIRQYIIVDAGEQVNISGPVRARILDRTHNGQQALMDAHLFDEAQMEIMKMMTNDSFARFKRSEYFDKYLATKI